MFSTQIIIDADTTEDGWDILIRTLGVFDRQAPCETGVIANYPDVSDKDLSGIVGDTIADDLLAQRGAS